MIISIYRWLVTAIAVLSVLILISAVTLVDIKHQNRKQFMELQKLYKARDQLDDEWGRLLLEQSTLVRQGRIEQIAREKLEMVIPDSTQIVVMKIKKDEEKQK
ncbi:cell division protein FtsL [Candidatus Nitrosacidococcus tergens]|uniref:Cell division protein FtsL n=1 Tax=Candidatus Nitrosacidococcus tergens TaxID=553981 RepID=A0A7G1QB47_9GAMM|nr:cell division protein FtsL [Candidatus Nitrosacidococcus tergens]CAB1276946.1 Cell division protein FtsL [Candidatus Nitrosacidococcus tergens]